MTVGNRNPEGRQKAWGLESQHALLSLTFWTPNTVEYRHGLCGPFLGEVSNTYCQQQSGPHYDTLGPLAPYENIKNYILWLCCFKDE